MSVVVVFWTTSSHWWCHHCSQVLVDDLLVHTGLLNQVDRRRTGILPTLHTPVHPQVVHLSSPCNEFQQPVPDVQLTNDRVVMMPAQTSKAVDQGVSRGEGEGEGLAQAHTSAALYHQASILYLC